MPWTVYVILSDARDETYVGVTTDVARRLDQHNGLNPGGARTTTRGRPWRIGTTYGPFETRGEAQRLEHEVKRLRGRDRLSAR